MGHFSKGFFKCPKNKPTFPEGVVGSAKRSSKDDSFTSDGVAGSIKGLPKFAKKSQELG